MPEIIDKSILFISCFVFYLLEIRDIYTLIPMIIVITLSALCTYFENRYINLLSTILFSIICIYNPYFLVYLPIMVYDILFSKDMKYGLVYVIPFILKIQEFDVTSLVFIGLLLLLASLVKYKALQVDKLSKDYRLYRDTTKEMEILLEEKNQSLLENQDYEINVATLNERNRISKEIHDNIGHLLSRSLLQIGALLTITKEPTSKEGLTQLKNSISEGMDSIRNSIHNMHDESIDLYISIDTLVKDFTFCSIQFDYNINTSPELKLKYCFIAIVKEALSNIIKHSNATKVSVLLMEHPIMYQIVISDNGVFSEQMKKEIQDINQNISHNDGMGLKSIIDRVRGFDGIINISVESGFKIFITIPKKKELVKK